MFTIFLQSLVTGILIGGVYALMASGLSLIFGVMSIANAAHASFAILSAYIVYWFYVKYGVNPLIGSIFSLLILFIIGVALYRFVVSRVSELMAFTLLFMISMFMESTMVFTWTNLYRRITIKALSRSIEFYGVYFPLDRLTAFAIAIGAVAILAYILKYTYFGKAVRATMQNIEAASLMGIDVERIYLITFGLGIVLAGIAGVMLGIIYPFYPALAASWIGLLFAIVVFGGLGSLTGTLAASFILGVANSLVSTYYSSSWAPMIAFLVLIITLWIRPSGLFGRILR